MSVVFQPGTFAGLGWNWKRYYEWNTAYQKALANKRSVLAYSQYPLTHFEFEYNILHDDVAPSEIQTIVGLFNSVQGRFGTLLLVDPDFNTISVANAGVTGLFGTSTGSTATPYQLTALYAPTSGAYSGVGSVEIVQNLNGTPILYDNGAVITASHYTIGATGIVTFSTSPTSGHALSWSGSFYYRVSFDDDELSDVVKFMNQWWSAKLKMTSIIL